LRLVLRQAPTKSNGPEGPLLLKAGRKPEWVYLLNVAQAVSQAAAAAAVRLNGVSQSTTTG
jgi:hypothetical protein